MRPHISKQCLGATLFAAVVHLDMYAGAGPWEWQLLRNLIQFLFEYGALRGESFETVIGEFNLRWFPSRRI